MRKYQKFVIIEVKNYYHAKIPSVKYCYYLLYLLYCNRVLDFNLICFVNLYALVPYNKFNV